MGTFCLPSLGRRIDMGPGSALAKIWVRGIGLFTGV